jgi:hypothetical protein
MRRTSQASGFRLTASQTNKLHNIKCIGRRFFHQILSPRTSIPVSLFPINIMYIHPITGISARNPSSIRNHPRAKALIMVKIRREPIQPNKNRKNRIFIGLSVIILLHLSFEIFRNGSGHRCFRFWVGQIL